MIEIKHDFQHRMRELLNYFDVTQNEVCEKVGIPRSAMSMYLSGKRNPKQDKIYSISHAYGVDPIWLMGLDVPMFKDASGATESHHPFIEMTTRDGLYDVVMEMTKDNHMYERVMEYAKMMYELKNK